MPPREATEIDAHVGARVRQRRMLLGLTQQTIAQALGLSFQQVQKYENGASRISAGRLFVLARLLETNVAEFYDGLDNIPNAGGTDEASLRLRKFVRTREGIRLVVGYLAVKDKRARMSILRLLESKG